MLPFSGGEKALDIYVTVSAILVTYPADFGPSDDLKVTVGGETKETKIERKGGATRRWNLVPSVDLTSIDSLKVQTRRTHFNPRNWFKDETGIEFSFEDIMGALKRPEQLSKSVGDVDFELEAGLRLFNFDSLTSPPDVSKMSSKDFLDGIGNLRSTLEYVGRASNVLDGCMESLQSLSKVHPFSQAAVMLLTIPYTLLKREKVFYDNLQKLAESVKSLLPSLEKICSLIENNLVKVSFMEMMKLILEVSRRINVHLNKSRLGKAKEAQLSGGVIKDDMQNFDKLKSNLFDALQTQTASGVDKLVSDGRIELLRKHLNPSNQQTFGDGCLKGTRTKIRKDIDAWLKDDGKPNILWITGSPGAGKTGLASSIVKSYDCDSFFFKHDSSELRDPRHVWPTIAFALAQRYTKLRTYISDFLEAKSESYVKECTIVQQFEELIEQPLQSIVGDLEDSLGRPKCFKGSEKYLVIIIDALDECDSKGTSKDNSEEARRWSAFLKTLKAWADLPRVFKLIITSRNESDIECRLPERIVPICLLTGIDVDKESSEDIRIFLESSFERIAEEHPQLKSVSWPGSKAIEDLKTHAAGLFIWADVVVSLIGSDDFPDEVLSSILDNPGWQQDGKRMDILYGRILGDFFNGQNPNRCEAYGAILGAIVFAKNPLRVHDLQDLLSTVNSLIREDRECRLILSVVRKLGSVISGPGLEPKLRDTLVRARHLSFVEFFLSLSGPYGPDHLKSAAQRYAEKLPNPTYILPNIDPYKHAMNLTKASLLLMNRYLKFNILGFPSSHLSNSNVHDMAERIERNVPTSLRYACLYWAGHLADMLDPRSVLDEVKTFFHEHFLHWLEILSALKTLHIAPRLLPHTATSISHIDADLSVFVQDAARFTMTFYQPISESIPHIYLSALPFSPAQSSIASHYRTRFSNTLAVVDGRLKSWSNTLLTLTGHTDFVWSVGVTPDGKRVISGSFDGTIRIWDVVTGRSFTIEPVKGHNERVYCVAVTPDGKRIVSGSDDHTIRTWDVETGHILTTLTGHEGSVWSITVTPDGKRIISGSNDCTIRIWDAETGCSLTTEPLKGHNGPVYSVTATPDSKRIVSGSSDGTIRIWDAETGDSLTTEPLKGHEGRVWSVAVTPDGRRIVSGSADCTIRIWDAETGHSLTTDPLKGHGGSVYSVAVTPDSKRIISGSSDCIVRIWDAETGHSLMTERLEGHGGSVESVAVTPDGKRIISGSDDGTICIWDAERQRSLTTKPLESLDGRVYSVAVTLDNKHVDSGSNDHIICISDTEAPHSLMAEPLEGHGGSVESVAITPDGKRIVSGSFDGTIRIWDIDTGRGFMMEPLKSHDGHVYCVALTPDGRRIVSGSDNRNAICIWDAETGHILTTLTGHEGSVWSVAITTDGRRIVSGSDDHTIRIWDAEMGRDLTTEPLKGHNGPVFSVAITPDGKRIISGSDDHTIRIWDAETGCGLMTEPLNGHNGSVYSVVITQDGKRIVSGSDDCTIRIWDAETGHNVMVLKSHEGRIYSVTVTPDSKRIVSGSSDGTIRIWDAETGRSLMTEPLIGHDGPVWSVAVTPDGKRVVSGSGDNTIRVWGVDTASEWNTAPVISIAHTYGASSEPQDALGIEYLGVNAKITDGWTCTGPGHRLKLFWVPKENRAGLWRPRSLVIIAKRFTQLDFRRFKHGEDWLLCQSI